MSKYTKKPEVTTTQNTEKGRKTFHPSLINWSYLYLGKVPLTQINKNNINITFKVNQITPGTTFNGYISNGGSHPPKKRMTVIEDIKIILAYSPKKNNTNEADEYSVKNPATSVDSSSGRSKGNLFVSANAEIKKIMNIGNNGIANHTVCWAKTIFDKFKEPTHNNTVIITNPIDTSYETIWAADLNAPRKGYWELLAHPAIIIPYTPRDDTANRYMIPTLISETTHPGANGITA